MHKSGTERHVRPGVVNLRIASCGNSRCLEGSLLGSNHCCMGVPGYHHSCDAALSAQIHLRYQSELWGAWHIFETRAAYRRIAALHCILCQIRHTCQMRRSLLLVLHTWPEIVPDCGRHPSPGLHTLYLDRWVCQRQDGSDYWKSHIRNKLSSQPFERHGFRLTAAPAVSQHITQRVDQPLVLCSRRTLLLLLHLTNMS